MTTSITTGGITLSGLPSIGDAGSTASNPYLIFAGANTPFAGFSVTGGVPAAIKITATDTGTLTLVDVRGASPIIYNPPSVLYPGYAAALQRDVRLLVVNQSATAPQVFTITFTLTDLTNPTLVPSTYTEYFSITCFAAGTRIATPSGAKAVEEFIVGDLVMTVSGAAAAITWAGHRRVDLTRHPAPEMAAPIRFLRGAIADNVPERDVVVSPDHAIFIDGALIPAYLLVNGGTIRQETGRSSVTYHHVELAEHAILLAEGMPTESYLDTGNRGFFANAGMPVMLHPDMIAMAGREAGSCAPVVVDRARVAPVWEALNARAASQGFAAPTPETTPDADFHLTVQGRALRAFTVENGRHVFVLPPAATQVALVSRAARPNALRPWLNDRRMLGVKISGILARDGSAMRHLAIDAPSLSRGWWDTEYDAARPVRWTDGNAQLDVPAGTSMLEITVAGTHAYPVARERETLAA